MAEALIVWLWIVVGPLVLNEISMTAEPNDPETLRAVKQHFCEQAPSAGGPSEKSPQYGWPERCRQR